MCRTSSRFSIHFYPDQNGRCTIIKENSKVRMSRYLDTLEKISAWNLTKVKSKKSGIDEARTSGATVHFASLMDICHLKNAELEAKHQKYKGRVVLRGDIVKDNSGSCAVFTEQGSSASQITAAKIMDIISRWPGCDGQAGLYPSKNGRCSQNIENFKIGVSRHLDSSTTTRLAKIMVQYGRPSQLFFSNEIRSVILWQDCFGNDILRTLNWNTVGRKFQIGNAFWETEKNYSYL